MVSRPRTHLIISSSTHGSAWYHTYKQNQINRLTIFWQEIRKKLIIYKALTQSFMFDTLKVFVDPINYYHNQSREAVRVMVKLQGKNISRPVLSTSTMAGTRT